MSIRLSNQNRLRKREVELLPSNRRQKPHRYYKTLKYKQVARLKQTFGINMTSLNIIESQVLKNLARTFESKCDQFITKQRRNKLGRMDKIEMNEKLQYKLKENPISSIFKKINQLYIRPLLSDGFLSISENSKQDLIFERQQSYMSADSSFSDSFELDNIISRNTPRQMENNQNNPRSRFSILTDFAQSNPIGKKTQEQSLLSKYLKDLHEQQNDRPTLQSSTEHSIRHNISKQNKEKESVYERQSDWRKKNGVHYASDKLQLMSQNSSEHMRESKVDSTQTKNLFLDTYGIIVYKKTIDLSKPIDFVCQQKENYQRNFGQNRYPSRKNINEKSIQGDMLFRNALKKQKNNRC